MRGREKRGKFKDLTFERTVKEIKDFFLRGVATPTRRVGKAGAVPGTGAFLGTYADYESNDRSIKLPLMEIPRSVRILRDRLHASTSTMWVKVLGFTEDPRVTGTASYPPYAPAPVRSNEIRPGAIAASVDELLGRQSGDVLDRTCASPAAAAQTISAAG